MRAHTHGWQSPPAQTETPSPLLDDSSSEHVQAGRVAIPLAAKACPPASMSPVAIATLLSPAAKASVEMKEVRGFRGWMLRMMELGLFPDPVEEVSFRRQWWSTNGGAARWAVAACLPVGFKSSLPCRFHIPHAKCCTCLK